MNDLINKVIRLDNGESYVTIDYTNYEGITYFLGNNVIDGHLGSDIVIFKVEKTDNEMKFHIEPNIDVCEKVIEKLQEKNK